MGTDLAFTGARIREARLRLELTLHELAREAGVHWMTVWRAEQRADRPPSRLVERAIGDALRAVEARREPPTWEDVSEEERAASDREREALTDAEAEAIAEEGIDAVERGRRWMEERDL